jgi:hypothetical protein
MCHPDRSVAKWRDLLSLFRFTHTLFIDDCKTNVQVSLFRANFEKRFVSGHDFSRAEKRPTKIWALAPAALFPSQFGFGSVRQLNLRGGHYLCSIQ